MPSAIPVPSKFGNVLIGDFVTANRFDEPNTQQGLLVGRGSDRLQILAMGGERWCTSHAVPVPDHNLFPWTRRWIATQRRRIGVAP